MQKWLNYSGNLHNLYSILASSSFNAIFKVNYWGYFITQKFQKVMFIFLVMWILKDQVMTAAVILRIENFNLHCTVVIFILL